MRILLPLLVVMAVAPLAGAQEPARSAEQKVIQERYGAAIAKARATPDPQDDIELARQMVKASRPSDVHTATTIAADLDGYRAALALEAFNLVVTIGSEDAVKVAEDALAQSMMIRPMDETLRLKRERDIAVTRFNKSAGDKIGLGERSVLALIAAQRLLDHAEALIRNGDVAAAREELNLGNSLVRPFDQPEMIEKITTRLQELAADAPRRAQVDQAAKALQEAQASGDASGISAAKLRLALAYLQNYGDIAAAAPYFKGSGHEWAIPVERAARYLADPGKFPAADLLRAADSLVAVCQGLTEESARKKVAGVALQMLDAYMAGKIAGAETDRARQLHPRLEKLAGQTEKDKLLAAVERGYPNVQGNITIVDAQQRQIKVSYPFSAKKEILDFVVPAEAQYKIGGGGALVGESKAQAITQNRLVFDASKPLTVSFRTSGPDRLESVLVWSNTIPFTRDASYDVTFTIGFDGSGGAIMGSAGEPFFKADLENHPPTVNQVVIAWNGQGSITWTVNGVKLTTWDSKMAEPRPKFMRVGLKTAGASTTWSSLSIEGTILTDPMWATTPNPPPAHEEPPVTPPTPKLGPTTAPTQPAAGEGHVGYADPPTAAPTAVPSPPAPRRPGP